MILNFNILMKTTLQKNSWGCCYFFPRQIYFSLYKIYSKMDSKSSVLASHAKVEMDNFLSVWIRV